MMKNKMQVYVQDSPQYLSQHVELYKNDQSRVGTNVESKRSKKNPSV